MVVRLKTDSVKDTPFSASEMDQEIYTTYKQFTKSYSEGCKTPSNDVSQVSDHVEPSDQVLVDDSDRE